MSGPAKKYGQEEPSRSLKVAADKPTFDVNAILAEAASNEEELEFYKKRARGHSDDSELWLISYADMMTLLVGFFIVLFSFSKIDSNEYEKVKKETSKIFGGEYQKPFAKLSSQLHKVVDDNKMGDQVIIQESEEGVTITFRGALFFESGSTDLKAAGAGLLKKLIPTINENSQDMGIVVEGHTDNRPIVSPLFASNWELSSVRACTVLRTFLENKFNPDKIKAIGWGDRRPVVPNDDASGNPLPENEAQNRRVVIRILKNFEN
jgi:chemotaxis protein MotB